MAMGQNPIAPVNIPTSKIGSKMGGASKAPKWDPMGLSKPQPDDSFSATAAAWHGLCESEMAGSQNQTP